MGKFKATIKKPQKTNEKTDANQKVNVEKLKLNKNVKFKATQKTKEIQSTFSKLSKPKQFDTDQLKTIKQDLIKNANESKANEALKKAPKSILKKNDDRKLGGVEKKIKKKDKLKNKQQTWQKKIASIKTDLKETQDKKKRENTVITGDMKKLQDTLLDNLVEAVADNVTSTTAASIKNAKKVSSKLQAQINTNNQNSKSIRKESVRNKQLSEDITLYSQLVDFPQFIKNPLDTLKLHFK